MSTLRAGALIVVVVATVTTAAAQQGRGTFGATTTPRQLNYGSLGGFGNVVYPGTGHAPNTPVGITDPNLAFRRPGIGFKPNGGGRRPVVVNSFYPVFGGGFYGGGFYGGGYGGGYYGDPGNGYQENPNGNGITIINPQQSMPPVIINQNFIPERANPVMREYPPEPTSTSDSVQVYEAPGRPPAESEGDQIPYYLLAFKDGSVYTAFAYWVEGDTLHYVTSMRVHNQASLTLVDRALTERLNMPVKLPK
jgi:hypothetical protein